MRKLINLLIFTLIVLSAFAVILTSCADEETYIVKFETNCADTITTSEAVKGDTISEPESITKNGYIFDGWYIGDKLWDFETDTVTENVVLTAKWKPIEYTASFIADGVAVQTVKFTVESTELSSVPTVPSKNGYTGEWESYTLGMQDITVNAVYSVITYNITYENLNGCTHNNPSTYTVESDKIVLAELPSSDSIFGGWYDAKGNRVTEIDKGSFGDLVLTARWTDKYTVTFDSDGGSGVPSQLVAPGGKVTAPDDPTKTGYSFDGWYCEDEIWSFKNSFVNENIVLKAKWTLIQYDAKFYADGELVDTVKFTVEDTFLSSVPEMPNKVGYSGTWQNYTLEASDLEINALYTPITYTITYNNLRDVTNPNLQSYTIESSLITLSDLSGGATDFLGWYNEDGEKITSIPSGSVGNIVLTAKWQITYEEYVAMSDDERTNYIKSFSSLREFVNWFNEAKAKYDEEQDRVIIDDNDTSIEIN